MRCRHTSRAGSVSYARLSISDTGTGIDELTRAKLFEPFFTTKEEGKGSGLGLSIVYGIVKQNGGYVAVVSERGKGATFHLYLPLAASVIEPTLAPAERSPSACATAASTLSIRRLPPVSCRPTGRSPGHSRRTDGLVYLCAQPRIRCPQRTNRVIIRKDSTE